MVTLSRSFRPKLMEDVWVLINDEYVLSKFIGIDNVTHEIVVRIDNKITRVKPQILPYINNR